MGLTSDQQSFLKRYKIPLESVFDATGMSPRNYGPKMKSLGKSIAVGVSPCKKSGHTMKDRHGRCVQCNPASIAFRNRYHKTGFIYLAGTLSGNLLKIGFTDKLKQRGSSLNAVDWYANIKDWRILIGIKCENAGTVEKIVKNNLREFNLPLPYKKNGKSHTSEEVFSCSFSKAWAAICKIKPTVFEFQKLDVSPLDYEFEKDMHPNSDMKTKRVPASKPNDLENLLETYVPIGVFRLCCAVCGKQANVKLLTEFIESFTPANSQKLLQILETLPKEEKALLVFRFGLHPKSHDISLISDELLFSPASSYKIENDGLRKMRYPSRLKKLLNLFPMMTPGEGNSPT